MPSEKPSIQAPVSPQQTAVEPDRSPAHEGFEQDQGWFEESDELPRRPRRRLAGPVPAALLAALLIACGFIGGVLVEKGESSSSSPSAAGGALGSRLAALRGASTRTSSGTGGSAASAGFGRPTTGTVAYVSGRTLYVTDSEGNTVKITTSSATSVTRTVKSSPAGIHPGETVSVVGSTATNGSVGAESISIGSGGALAGLFGSGSSSASASKAAGGSAGASPSLFGSG